MKTKILVPKFKQYTKNKEKKISWSMFILIWAQLLASIALVFALIMCYRMNNLDPLAYLIPAVFVDASAVTAVVLWKRKHENIIIFLSSEKFKKAIEWLKSKDIDPAEFIRVLKDNGKIINEIRKCR